MLSLMAEWLVFIGINWPDINGFCDTQGMVSIIKTES